MVLFLLRSVSLVNTVNAVIRREPVKEEVLCPSGIRTRQSGSTFTTGVLIVLRPSISLYSPPATTNDLLDLPTVASIPTIPGGRDNNEMP